MSVINQMLKDLEQRQQAGEGAIYVAPVRQQGWWMLVLTLLCGLALGILGWRSWIYWQQVQALQHQAALPQPAPAHGSAAPASGGTASAEPEVRVVALPAAGATPAPGGESDAIAGVTSRQDVGADPVPSQVASTPLESVPAASTPLEPVSAASASLEPVPAASASLEPVPAAVAVAEEGPSDEDLQPELYAELAAEQPEAAPRPPGVLKIETVDLSPSELAALAERKATTAMAKGQLQEARDNYYQVLSHDPDNQGARQQLAGLLYGEEQLDEANRLLEEGVRRDPAQPDFRLLLARLAISGGDQRKALDWLAGLQPDLVANQDYYATWAGLAEELGQNGLAAEIYLKLLAQQPDQGRWWLGLGVAEDGQGHSQRALDAYRNARLHGNLGEASANWLEQRIAQLAP